MRQSLLTTLRDRKTDTALFRRTADKMMHLLAQDAFAQLPEKVCRVRTPLASTKGRKVTQSVVLVPILRAGLAMLPVFMQYLEEASVGFMGLKRDEETAKPYQYYQHLPRIKRSAQVLILDPMIATGGSATATIQALIAHGVKERQILFVSLISSRPGLRKLKKTFPDIRLVVGETDPQLNADHYILPGIGDFGDRYFGTGE